MERKVASALFSAPQGLMKVQSLVEDLIRVKPKFSFVVPSAEYIPRPQLEKRLLDIYESKQTFVNRGIYHVVFGAEGVGKSTTIIRVFEGKEGVIAVNVSQGDTAQSVFEKISRACGIPKLDDEISLKDFDLALSLASSRLGNDKRIAIILEVERCGDITDARGVLAIAKLCAQSANVIIVLSEANAVPGFCDDDRQEYIWFGGMEETEAYALFDLMMKDREVDKNELKVFFDAVGTHPLHLQLLARAILRNNDTVENFKNEVIRKAFDDLAAFSHKSILEKLRESPSGVKVHSFEGIVENGVNLAQPKEVAKEMKNSRAIIYHRPSGEYRLFSKAHATALKTKPSK